MNRETQLVVRATVRARELDAFLTEKDEVAQEIEHSVRDLLEKHIDRVKTDEANRRFSREYQGVPRICLNGTGLSGYNPGMCLPRDRGGCWTNEVGCLALEVRGKAYKA